MAARLLLVVAFGAVGVTTLALGATPATPAAAVVDNPDIDTSADYLYRADIEEGEIEVTIELSVTADKPNVTTDNGYYQYYFEGMFLLVPSGIGDLSIVDRSGQPLTHTVDEQLDDADALFIRFRRNLYYRQTADIVVSFTLPGGEPRGDGLTRVNGAYAGFQAWVDPRLEEASVTIVAPDEFTDRSVGSDDLGGRPLAADVPDGERWLVVDDIDPEDFWSGVSLTRDEGLVSTRIEVDGHGIEIEAWPDDEVWQRFVADQLSAGLPMLIDRVGLAWPLEEDLKIVESFVPYVNGYAGWYDVVTDEIEIGDELHTHVMFHELSHVWFHGQLFNERWITEGLADHFGGQVVEDLDEGHPRPPGLGGFRSAHPLNSWTDFTEDVDVEEWSYGASWRVTREIGREVGIDGLSKVIQAADGDLIAYLGDDPNETETRRNDWRLYLDLLTNLDGVDEASEELIVELFDRWVVTVPQRRRLDERAASRAGYAELVEAGLADADADADAGDGDGGGWAAPLAVRSAMSDWNFEEADALMVEAGEILAERDRLIGELAPLEASLPEMLEETYEAAEDDLTEADDLIEQVAEGVDELRAADRSIAEASGPLPWIGTIGGDLAGDLALAVDRFEGGGLEEAITQADAVVDEADGSARRGLIRLLVGLAVLTLAIAGTILWRRRRADRPPSPPTGRFPQADVAAGRNIGGAELLDS